MGQNNRFWSFIGAAIVGLIVYSWLALKTASLSGAFGGFVPLLIFGMFLLALTGLGAPAGAGAGAGGGGIGGGAPRVPSTPRAPAAPRRTWRQWWRGTPAAPGAPVPPGPAGVGPAINNAQNAGQAAAADVTQTQTTIGTTIDNAGTLAQQHTVVEREVGNAVNATEVAIEEVEAVTSRAPSGVPPPEEDLYSQNVRGAAKEAFDLVKAARAELEVGTALVQNLNQVAESVPNSEIIDAEFTVCVEGAIAKVDEVAQITGPVGTVEIARDQLIAVQRTASTDVVSGGDVLIKNMSQDAVQLQRFRTAAFPILAAIHAIALSIQEKRLPKKELSTALVQLGSLEKQLVQVSESYKVEPEVIKKLLAALNQRLIEKKKALDSSVKLLEDSERKMKPVVAGLLASPKEPEIVAGPPAGAVEAEVIQGVPKETFVDKATLNRIALLLSHSRELIELVQAIEHMNVTDSPSREQIKLVNDAAKLAGTWYSGDIVTIRNIASAIMKGGMEDLAGMLSPQHLGVLNNLSSHLASLVNAFKSEKRRSQPLEDSVVNFRAQQHGARLSVLIKDLEFVLQRFRAGPTA